MLKGTASLDLVGIDSDSHFGERLVLREQTQKTGFGGQKVCAGPCDVVFEGTAGYWGLNYRQII